MQEQIFLDLRRLIDRCSVSIEEFESELDHWNDWEALLQMYSRFALDDLILGAALDAAMNRS